MTLKIIHHKEKYCDELQEDNLLDLNIEENLQKLFSLCVKIIDISNMILGNIDLQTIKNNNIEENEIYSEQFEKNINIFYVIFGKKTSILDAISKTTIIMQKIQILAEKFGVSLIKPKKEKNIEYLTDDDIDVMVQLVKDFGEEQLRNDIKEINEQLKQEEEAIKKETKKNEMDIYDVYHLNNRKNE